MTCGSVVCDCWSSTPGSAGLAWFARSFGWPAGSATGAAWSLPITPTFVLPYKRYAGPTLLHLAARYVEEDRQTYRGLTTPQGVTIGYVTPPGAADEERKLSHSTIWRMLSWLGVQVPALLAGYRQILDHNPSSLCHRFLGAVAPRKYRSRKRQRLLSRSRQVVHLIAEWEELFPERFFPRFATRSGFG
jgi:hypothetical protein